MNRRRDSFFHCEKFLTNILFDNGWQITKEKKSQVFSLLCGYKQPRKLKNLDLKTLI